MKNFTKLFLMLLLVGATLGLQAQYCTFTVDYVNSFESGITHVGLNSNPAIDRTSNTIENNGFTNTGLTVSVTQGVQYTLDVTRNQDIMVCGSYNCVVYIDLNGDQDFEDPGEDVKSWLNVPAGVGTFNLTIPGTSTLGTTGMRIALKMENGCGHISVSPCNIPVDGTGWHGEIENYTLDIQAATGVEDNNSAATAFTIIPNANGNAQIAYNLVNSANVTLDIYNVIGQKVSTVTNGVQSAGSYSYTVDNAQLSNANIYFATLKVDDTIITKKFAVR